MDPFRLYFNTLISCALFVSGEDKMSTWTLHKGLLRLLGNDWLAPEGRPTTQSYVNIYVEYYCVYGKRALQYLFIKIIWLLVYPFLYIFVLVISTALTIKYVLQREYPTLLEYSRAMNGVVVCFAFVYAICKSLIFKLAGKNIRLLMVMVDELGEVDEDARPQRDSAVKNATLYLGLLCLIPATWTLCSMVYMHNIPFPTDWPWGDHTPFRYSLSFAIAFIAATYCAVLHSTFDTIFPICAGTICGHIVSMSRKLERLGSGDKEEDIRMLAQSYRLHVNLLRISKHINRTYGLIFLTQSFYTVLHACVIIYQVMKVSNITLAALNTAPLLSSSYTQFLLFCYYGELLTDYFEKLRFALYNNHWYQCEIGLKKKLVTMTLAANRTVRLESYGITFAGHKTYVSGLQDSISYYLILKTVTSDQQ